MKYILLTLSFFAFYSCSEKVYPYQEFENDYPYIFDDVLEADLGEIESVYRYQFEMCYCEVEINGVLKRGLAVKRNCQGKIFETHFMDLWEITCKGAEKTQAILHSYKMKSEENIIGSMLFLGGEKTKVFEKDAYLFKKRTSYIKTGKESKSDEGIQFKKMNNGETDLSLLYDVKTETDSISGKPENVINIYSVHYRMPNKVGGSEPIFFDMEKMFQRPVSFKSKKEYKVKKSN